MSQPVALIARIPITEADFKKFLSSPAAKTLAGCIAEALSEPTEEAGEPHYYVVFRYLKPEQAVFAFIYFRYGNATDLCESREWQVLQVLATYTQDGPPGFVLHSLDALNLFESIAAAFSVAGGCCTETSFAALGFDQEQFRKDCRKYFYAVMREN
ncbi:MAG: hypothetical protein LBQ20_01200, partial [Rhodanobacter sp.]|nr:hypothetical protein [Rhodanobacter sp.]